MSINDDTPHPTEDPQAFLRDRFDDRRDTLEALAELDTELSEDAERILELMDGGQS